MARRSRDVVVVGASAGGVEALRAMVGGLPPRFAASVVVVLHMPAGGVSALPAILSRAGPLPAETAQHGEQLRHGRIYVARPGHHLLVEDGTVVLSHGPAESGHRPAVDALFRSAAVARGAAVTGVLLSGMLDDGVAGLRTIADCGGCVIVQEPADAIYPAMPHNAMRVLTPDHVVRAADIGQVLAKLVEEEVEVASPAPDVARWENGLAVGDRDRPGPQTVGMPTAFSCPDCDGVLSQIPDDDRFRCRVGHAWTAEALLAAQDSALDRALWTALRALEEKAALARRMADRAESRGDGARVARYLEQALEAESAAAVLHRQVTGQN